MSSSAMEALSPKLRWVHGFQPTCVALLAEKEVAFAAGKLVVQMDVTTQQQRFVLGHSASVTCLAFSEPQALGASGQLLRKGAKWAEVLLWDSESLEICACFSFHQADIEAIAFIQDGEVLVSIGSDRDRTMALWPAAREGCFRIGRREGVPLAVCSAFKGGQVRGIAAAPGSSDLPMLFASYGVQHIKFWRSNRSGRLSQAVDGRRGAFGCDQAPKMIVCAVFVARDRLVAGGNTGEVFFFHGSRAVRKMELSSPSPVACLLPMKETLVVVHGNGMCHFLNSTKASDMDLGTLKHWPAPRFRTSLIAGAWKDRCLLLSSKTHLVYLDLQQGPPSSCQVLSSQPAEPLTSLALARAASDADGTGRLYSGALDGLVRCYDLKDFAQLEPRSFRCGAAGITCLAVSGTASAEFAAWLAVGCSDSTLSIMSESSYQYVLRRSLSGSKAKLTCAKFSSVDISGKHPLWLAVGTDDGCIHTFRFKEPGCKSSAYGAYGLHTGEEVVSKVATLRGHEASIFDLCFADTLPCNYLMSVDLSGKELAFDVPMARRLPSMGMVKDVPFHPWTLPVGPLKEKKLSRVHELSGRSSIAVATDAVEIWPFPCTGPPSISPPRLEGPSAQISSLLFNPSDDSLLASSDTALFVWSFQSDQAKGRMPLSPLRSVQPSETPDRRTPATPAFTPPPRTRVEPQVSRGARGPNGAPQSCSSCQAALTAPGHFCQNCGQKRVEPLVSQVSHTPQKVAFN